MFADHLSKSRRSDEEYGKQTAPSTIPNTSGTQMEPKMKFDTLTRKGFFYEKNKVAPIDQGPVNYIRNRFSWSLSLSVP